MTEPKKNILLVSLDDSIAYWKYKTVFNEPLQTPNLDRICQHATTFQSAYCQAPICGPSRASFMSAKSPHEIGIFDNKIDAFEHIGARSMWSLQLKNNGYFCSSGGKVHHRFKPVRKRYHNWLYSDRQKRFTDDMHLPRGAIPKEFGGHRRGWATTDAESDSSYYDAQSADSAIEFLSAYKQEQPFYREVGFFSPHGPHFTPARFKEMYNEENFVQPEEWRDGFDYNEYTVKNRFMNPFLKNNDIKWWRASVRNYFSALSHGDYHLGRVWDALQSSQHAKNTIVIILSDHGFHLGNRHQFNKTTLWEQVAGVPLIIHDPDHPNGQEIHDPVALVDVGPTVLDYAGLPEIENCVGQSLLPHIEGETLPDRTIPTFHHDNAAIRKGKFRFIRYEDGSTQLYDLDEDYWQLRDLGSDHPAYESMYDSLISCSDTYGLSIHR